MVVPDTFTFVPTKTDPPIPTPPVTFKAPVVELVLAVVLVTLRVEIVEDERDVRLLFKG